MHTPTQIEENQTSDPKTLHIWMPDRRTLCDLRAELPTSIYDMDDEEYKQHQKLQRDAPACGSCILIVGRLRNEAVAIMQPDRRPRVWPSSPRAAWARLLGTRWEGWYAIREFIEDESIDQKVDFGALRFAVDPERVEDRRLECAHAKSLTKSRTAYRVPQEHRPKQTLH